MPYLSVIVSALVFIAFGLAAQARNGVWREGVTLWQNTAALSPGKARVHTRLGSVLNAAGRREEAREAFRRALALDGASVEALNNLATALLASGDTEGAVVLLRRALVHQPDAVQVRYNLGVALLGLGRDAEARAAFTRAQEDLSRNAGAWLRGELLIRFNLGNLAMRANRLEEAAAELNAGMAEAHYRLAIELAAMDQAARARTALERALALSPGHQEARRALQALKQGK